MKYFLFKIATRYASYVLGTWAILFLLDILISKLISSPINLFASLIGFIVAAVFSVTAMNMSRWPLYWRRVSENVSLFWLGILAISFFNIAINGACYYLILWVFPAKDVSSFAFAGEKLDIVWIVILTYLYSLVSLFDQKAMLANNALKPGKQILIFLGIYSVMLVFFGLVVYSRLLGYGFVAFALLTLLMLRNNFVISSLQRRLRFQILAIFFGLTIVMSVVSYIIGVASTAGYSNFLGRLGPKNVWNYSDLGKVEKPSEWIKWWNDANRTDHKLTNEEKIAALEKLELICPVVPTDSPARIDCREKDIESKDVIIYGSADEGSILVQLESSHMYVRLLGILSARNLKEISVGLKNALEQISNKPGRLGPVAENTLARSRKESAGLRIFVREE